MKKVPFLSSILFAIYPALFLYSYNLGKVLLNQLILPITILIIFSIILLFLLNLYVRNIEKTSLLVSVFFILFFSYGHIYRAIDGNRIGAIHIGWPGYLLPLFILFYICFFVLIKNTKTEVKNAVTFFLIISVGLIAYTSINILIFEVGKVNEQNFGKDFTLTLKDGSLQKIKRRPSIYYLILDAYARNDVLKEIYNYDNDDFINYLKNKGFFVGEKSSSNYCQTALSLTSSLNMTYLDSLANYVGVGSYDRGYLSYQIQQNLVMKFLKNYGYKTVAFCNGYTLTKIDNADIYLKQGFYLNELMNALINFTPISGFINYIYKSNQFTLHGENILFMFEKLKEISTNKYPKFVIAHFLSPHPPFIFTRKGMKKDFIIENFSLLDGSDYIQDKPALRKEYIEGYKEQLIYISNKVKELVNQILKNDKDAVIILQSDHGPGSMLDWKNPKKTYMKERMSILNAIYLPDSSSSFFNKEITPVNTFRIILNRYFNQNYEILKNESFFSTWLEPYRFIKIDSINNKMQN